MAPDIAFFRRVMGQFATGITIVTTRSQEGIAGLTVNSFTSVSLNPLLVLVCIDLRSKALPFIRAGGVFAINILAQEQEELSNCFASSSNERYAYFCHAQHHVAATGAPILADTLGFIDARVTTEYPGGDHAIFLGKVEAMGYEGQTFFMPGIESAQNTLLTPVSTADPISGNGHNEPANTPVPPLLYYRGQYYHLSNLYHHQHPELAPTTAQQHDKR